MLTKSSRGAAPIFWNDGLKAPINHALRDGKGIPKNFNSPFDDFQLYMYPKSSIIINKYLVLKSKKNQYF